MRQRRRGGRRRVRQRRGGGRPQIGGDGEVTQVGIERGAMTDGSSGGGGEGLTNFGTAGVVVHGGRIVLGIGEDLAVASDDGDSGAALHTGLGGPRGQRLGI